jgi:type I restriction enzyme S subunit
MVNYNYYALPLGWKVTQLSEVVEFLDNKRIPIEVSERQKKQGIYPYYGASGIIDFVNDFIFDDLILLAEDGANILDRSTPIAFRVLGKVWVNNHAHVLKPKKSVNIEYLVSYLESLSYEKFNSGSAQPKLNRKICEKIPVLLPSISEQHKIAEILASWDEAIAKTEKLITAKQKLRKTIANEILKGRLKFHQFSQQKWCSEKLENLAKTFSGGTPSRTNSEYFQGEIPWIKSGEINKEIINFTEESITETALIESSARMISPGTILIAMYGATAGKIAISQIKAAINQAILAVVPLDTDQNFLYYFLKNEMDQVVKKVQGGQPNLNAKIIKETKISLPTVEEQTLIGRFLKLLDTEIQYLEQIKTLYQQ